MSDLTFTSLIIPFVTVLFGGVVAALLTQTSQILRNDTERKLVKLEELYTAMQDAYVWGKQYQDLRIAVVSGALTFTSTAELRIYCNKIDNEHSGAYKRLMVLCDIWFPMLKESAQNLINGIMEMYDPVRKELETTFVRQKDPRYFDLSLGTPPKYDVFYWNNVLAKEIVEEAKAIRRGKIFGWVSQAIK